MELQKKMEALKNSLSGAKRGGKGADPEVSTSKKNESNTPHPTSNTEHSTSNT